MDIDQETHMTSQLIFKLIFSELIMVQTSIDPQLDALF